MGDIFITQKAKKDMIYDFINLSYVYRLQILQKLNLIEPDEYDVPHVKLLEKILDRCQQRQLFLQFNFEVTEAKKKMHGDYI